MIELVIEAMVDAVVVINADGRITLANFGAEHVTGYSREELRALDIGKLFVDDGSGLKTVVRQRIEGGDVLRREESSMVTRSGERVPVSITASPVTDEAGGFHGIVLVARDLRETKRLLAEKQAELELRKRAEDQLRAAKLTIEEQLEQTRTQLLLAERRATLGTLAGGVGHELRNIAQVQVAAVDEIAAALRANDDVVAVAYVRRVLPELERVGTHITEHGERLMQLARPGPDHVEPIDFGGVVRDVRAMLSLAGKLVRVDLQLELPERPITVTVNRTRIEQILVNLIINAVDAMNGAGVLTITVHTRGGRAVCDVRDTGSGIPEAQREKIFEPFFTTKGERGTGLGLPVVRDIVASYGGTLTVTSTVGAGTTFTFDLPC